MKSTMWVRRVVLVNGEPSGKGRPGRDVKRTRTCLYIPVRETYGSHTKATSKRPYNPAKYTDQRKQFKRTNLSALKPVAQPATVSEPVVEVNAEPVAVEATAPEQTAEAVA